MRLWNPKDAIVDHEIGQGDEYKITEQFYRKMQSIQKGKNYVCDSSKDSLLSNFYDHEPFNLYEFCNREVNVGSIECKHIKQQLLDLQSYYKTEMLKIEGLINRYHTMNSTFESGNKEKPTDEETSKNLLALRGLIRIKASNLALIDQVKDCLVDIDLKAQESGDYIENVTRILKKKNLP